MGSISHYQRITQFPTYALARWYVQACGFSVLPLRPRNKQRLFGGTTFQEWLPCDHHLRKWFCTPQPYNLGIVTGAISGDLCVLDFDEFAVYQIWISQIPAASDLPCVRSARGVHVYCRLGTLPQGGRGSFDGMEFGDIIANGVITAPPSIHPSGHQYVWVGDPRRIPLFSCLAEISIEKVVAARSTPASERRPIERTRARPSGIEHPTAYAQAALAAEGRKIMEVGKGQRNRQLYLAALKLAKYLDILGETSYEQELRRYAQAAGMTEGADVIWATIQSGKRNGAEHGVMAKI